MQLKRIAAKLTTKELDGYTVPDVLSVIADNFSSGGGGVTIVSAELNADGNGIIKNGDITMSDGSIVEMNISSITALSVTSTEGSAINKTQITVEPPITEGNIYRYFVGSVVTPAKYEDLSSWTYWNGTDEIEAESGTTLVMAECSSQNKALKCGSCTVVSPIF